MDSAKLHQDSNFKTIAFSDTIVAYQEIRNLDEEMKSTELMFLIELTQEIFIRLSGVVQKHEWSMTIILQREK